MCMRKMSIYKTLGAAALVFAFGVAGANAADAPHFGQPISPADLAPWDISIGPDGVGLPAGSGTPAQGAQVYADHGCAACHGDKGSGGPGGPLVGGGPLSAPDKEAAPAARGPKTRSMRWPTRRRIPGPPIAQAQASATCAL